MKKCSDCKLEKQENEFSKNVCTKDGLQYSCKGCMRKRNRKWHLDNPSKQSIYSARQRQKNKIANLSKA